MPPDVLINQVPRPLDSDDELLDQEAIAAVGGEQASMDEAMIEGGQGQGQMVEQCGDVMVVEAGTSPSHLGMLQSQSCFYSSLRLMPCTRLNLTQMISFCDLLGLHVSVMLTVGVELTVPRHKCQC